jgi:PD-(D/E)XK nuclease superfamily
MHAPQLLTASRVRCWQACPRQHHYRYVRGVVPRVDAPALAFGTVIHTALAAYWLARQAGSGDALGAALAVLGEQLGRHVDDPFARVRAEVMVIGYATAWDQRPGVRVLEVEVQFRSPLFNPATNGKSTVWDLAGKLDLVLRLEDGRLAVVEHKTTTQDPGYGSHYRTRLTLDEQVSVYFTGAEVLGCPADVCVYDVLVKPGQEPLKATPPEARKYTKEGRLYASQRAHDETPGEYRDRIVAAVAENPARYFAQIEVQRLAGDRTENAADLWQLQRAMREAQLAGTAPRNSHACFSYGSPCPYLPVCERRASLDDARLYARLADPNPELSTPETHAP